MAENDKKTDEVVDPDTLTDAQFMELDVPPAEVADPNAEENSDGNSSNTDQSAADLAAAAAGNGDTSTGAEAGDGEGGQEGGGTEDEGGGEGSTGENTAGDAGELSDEEKAALAEAQAGKSDEELAAEAEAAKVNVNTNKETLKLKDGEEGEETAEAKTAREAQEVETAAIETQAKATDFYTKMLAPFKADGKEIQIRSAEEGIRLMQMGVNYSRRMEQMKPLREMDAMLTAHGLNTPEKLNELIDLSKGGVPALQKHLKKHSIDPLELDPSKSADYVTPNYQSDPKDTAFQDAINTTLDTEGGKGLLADVNRDWDDESKEALRENPSIFGKLLEQIDTGVYSQIQAELLHQRTMGYLANVPILQAYEQVGNAMQKAGVFDEKKTQKKGLAPIDSGSRKAPAKIEPNPNLSSKSAAQKVARTATPEEPDYLSMSDADFMNLAIPG